MLWGTGEERTLLRLLEGALDVSEYTDHVDVVRGFSWRGSSKSEVMQEQIYELFRMLSGLLIAGNYKVRSAAAACQSANRALASCAYNRQARARAHGLMRCMLPPKLVHILMHTAPRRRAHRLARSRSLCTDSRAPVASAQTRALP
jgi:hypothetical protein